VWHKRSIPKKEMQVSIAKGGYLGDRVENGNKLRSDQQGVAHEIALIAAAPTLSRNAL